MCHPARPPRTSTSPSLQLRPCIHRVSSPPPPHHQQIGTSLRQRWPSLFSPHPKASSAARETDGYIPERTWTFKWVLSSVQQSRQVLISLRLLIQIVDAQKTAENATSPYIAYVIKAGVGFLSCIKRSYSTALPVLLEHVIVPSILRVRITS